MPNKCRKPRKNRAALIAVAALALALAILLAIFLFGELERATYRLTHVDEIKRYSAQYGIDPHLVAAVIHVESGNREVAVSPKGAMGLMQIMPLTAEWIAEKLGEPFELESVAQPDTNIRYGCWYLRFLFDRFQPVGTVLAAYNAGHNAVRGWLSDERYSEDGATLREIPYPETRNYVEKVERAYERYKKLYPKAFDPA